MLSVGTADNDRKRRNSGDQAGYEYLISHFILKFGGLECINVCVMYLGLSLVVF